MAPEDRKETPVKHAFMAAFAAFVLLAQPTWANEAARDPAPGRPVEHWVEVLRQTALWSGPDDLAERFTTVTAGTHLLLVFPWVRPRDDTRVQIWNPGSSNFAWIDRQDTKIADGPSEGLRGWAELLPEPIRPARRFIWQGVARVTMYTCVELGGCNATASGIWPYEGIVAVDPRVIPLGSQVWIDGLGIFLAADTGSLVWGNRLDVYTNDYRRARGWGVQYLSAAAYVADQ
jgi:3D (Asp-Asp-Asp) domain-containing protein